MSTVKRKLPIGSQSFKGLREGGFIYGSASLAHLVEHKKYKCPLLCYIFEIVGKIKNK